MTMHHRELCFYLYHYFIVARQQEDEVIKISLIRTYTTRIGACMGDKMGALLFSVLHKVLLHVNQALDNSKQSLRIYELNLFLFSTY